MKISDDGRRTKVGLLVLRGDVVRSIYKAIRQNLSAAGQQSHLMDLGQCCQIL